MRKCEVSTNPECFAEATMYCEDCNKWFCSHHLSMHRSSHHRSSTAENEVEQLKKRIEELEVQNTILLKRAEDAETIVRLLSKELK